LILDLQWFTVVFAMVTLEQAIGERLRQLREACGIRQEEVAVAARKYGLKWTRATIAAIELGQRRLPLGELALIPVVLAEADVTGGRILALADLVPDDDRLVRVARGLELPAKAARALLGGQEVALPTPPIAEACGDAETKAASTLRVSPEAIVQAAHRRWGRSLTAERDRRVEAYTAPMLTLDPAEAARPGWPRRLQAIRGHVTRELLEELRPLLKGTTKKKRSR
jgi:transcriptional regulator with XRE-family HTH domain